MRSWITSVFFRCKCNKNIVAVESIVTISEDAILFSINSYEIQKDYYPILDKIADVIFNAIKNNTESKVEVKGHTDNIGKEEFNLILSQKRADSVIAYFVSKKDCLITFSKVWVVVKCIR